MSRVNDRVDYEKSPQSLRDQSEQNASARENLPTRGKARRRKRGVSFTRGRVSLSLLSLRKNGDYSQSNNREAFKKICVLVNGCAKIYTLRFRPRCQCRYYKKGSKLAQRTEIYALLPDLAWDKTISAKIINNKIKPTQFNIPILEFEHVTSFKDCCSKFLNQGKNFFCTGVQDHFSSWQNGNKINRSNQQTKKTLHVQHTFLHISLRCFARLQSLLYG